MSFRPKTRKGYVHFRSFSRHDTDSQYRNVTIKGVILTTVNIYEDGRCFDRISSNTFIKRKSMVQVKNQTL